MALLEEQAIKLKNENESLGTYLEAFIRGVMMDPFGKANEMRAAQNELERESAGGQPEH